jgi:hypothetical protein
VGSSPEGEKALMVMATDRPVGEAAANELRAADGITSVAVVGG